MFFSSGSSKAQKHGSSHASHRNIPSHSKGSKARSQSHAPPSTALRSFLFVVNELQVDFEPLPEDGRPLTDQWLNPMPPQHAAAYGDEIGGMVFRYMNGIVSQTHDYVWHRPERGLPGHIVRLDQAGAINGYPEEYKTHTIFACSALLPIIVTDRDASLGLTFMRRLCPMGCDTMYDETYSTWSSLHFHAGIGDLEDTSCVNYNSCGGPFTRGKDASWIPSLVPSVYRNTSPLAGPSRGLSGELPIILALMGFHGRPGGASEVFLNRNWNMNRWHGSNRASTYLPKSGESPRGLLVQVCADNLVGDLPDNEHNNRPVEECIQMLSGLEYSSILVRD